jgi:ribonuclease E
VLRIIEEEAMKKGTEKIVVQLPIESSTFLLNEKRSAIDELEKRLLVNIIILPSKHLETPAYDIERIKTKEASHDKLSYLQVQAEEITLPEFAKQQNHKTTPAAIKEFLPDMPAPVQNKKTSASLIHRFWQKLMGEAYVASVQKIVTQSAPEETQKEGVATEKTETQTVRKHRPPRKRHNNRPLKTNTETPKEPSESKIETGDVNGNIQEATPAETPKKRPLDQNRRRGPNRRKPRNPNYKKPKNDYSMDNEDKSPSVSNNEKETPEKAPKNSTPKTPVTTYPIIEKEES